MLRSLIAALRRARALGGQNSFARIVGRAGGMSGLAISDDGNGCWLTTSCRGNGLITNLPTDDWSGAGASAGDGSTSAIMLATAPLLSTATCDGLSCGREAISLILSGVAVGGALATAERGSLRAGSKASTKSCQRTPAETEHTVRVKAVAVVAALVRNRRRLSE